MNGQVVNLNVGGTVYSTMLDVLLKDAGSRLSEWFANGKSNCALPTDSTGNYFIDRDGDLFRFILDFLRNGRLVLPDGFQERTRLQQEADYYRLGGLSAELFASRVTYITVGYHGSFSFGRQGVSADVNFRKITRLLIAGRATACREVFGEALNEGRDPDRGDEDRYTARFFLKHNFLEQAFDALAMAGFRMITSCASGTSGPPADPGAKPGGATTEEERWAHYNEFIFYRS